MFDFFIHKILRKPIRLHVSTKRTVKKPKYSIIFLHGISATSNTWLQTFNLLKKDPSLNSIQLFNLDLLGYGKTLSADWLKYDYVEHEKALLATIKKLHIKTPIILIGHSMGALIAADFTRKHPEKVACNILVSPPVLLPTEIASLPDRFYQKTYHEITQNIENLPIETLSPFIEKITNFRSRYTKTTAFSQGMENIILNRENFRIFCQVRKLSVIIHGRFDALVYKPNLLQVCQKNPKMKLISTIGQHDINSLKRQKILQIIKEITK